MTYIFDVSSFHTYLANYLSTYIGPEAYSNNYCSIIEGITEGVLYPKTDYNFYYYIKEIKNYGVNEEVANFLVNRLITNISSSLKFLTRYEHDEYNVKIINKDTMFIKHKIKNYILPEYNEVNNEIHN